jgi:hypothetical protein
MLPQIIFHKLSLHFLVDQDDAAVDATSVITAGLIVADARFPFSVSTFPCLTMYALDALISLSEGLSLAPADAGRRMDSSLKSSYW